jgi:hypothetical protein
MLAIGQERQASRSCNRHPVSLQFLVSYHTGRLPVTQKANVDIHSHASSSFAVPRMITLDASLTRFGLG